jgi:putative proteasome-type protease
MVRSSWGQRLRDIFEAMEDPHWGADAAHIQNPLIVRTPRYDALKKIHNPSEKVI